MFCRRWHKDPCVSPGLCVAQTRKGRGREGGDRPAPQPWLRWWLGGSIVAWVPGSEQLDYEPGAWHSRCRTWGNPRVSNWTSWGVQSLALLSHSVWRTLSPEGVTGAGLKQYIPQGHMAKACSDLRALLAATRWTWGMLAHGLWSKTTGLALDVSVPQFPHL